MWVVPEGEICPSGYAFTRTWHGISEYGYGPLKKARKGGGMTHTSKYLGNDPIESPLFLEKASFCVNLSQSKFYEKVATQNSDGTFECPEGAVPCSKSALPVCISELDKLTNKMDECPITDIKLVKKEDFSEDLYQGYEIA